MWYIKSVDVGAFIFTGACFFIWYFGLVDGWLILLLWLAKLEFKLTLRN